MINAGELLDAKRAFWLVYSLLNSLQNDSIVKDSIIIGMVEVDMQQIAFAIISP